MSVVFDAVGPSSAGTSTTGTSLTWSHTCTGTDRLLTVSVSVGAASDDTETTATYNGVAMTSAGRVASNGQIDGYVELFYLVAPATGSNTVAITCTLSKSLVGGSVSFTGVDPATPVSNVTTNYGGSAAPTISVTSDYGNMVVDGLCSGSNINSSNQDMRWRDNVNTASAAGNGAQSTAPGKGTVTTTYSISSDWWGIIAMNINATPITSHPTLASTTTPDVYTTNTTPRIGSITTQRGDLVVVYGGGEDGTDTLSTPTGNGITFTLHQSVVVGNFATAFVWSGLDRNGGTWNMTVSNPNSDKWGYTCLVFRNTAGTGASNSANVSNATPTLSLTTTAANSAIVVFNADWNATDGASRVWQTVNNITPTATNLMEIDYGFSSIAFTAYGGYYPDAGAAGAKTLGLTAPGGQKYSIVALEILPPAILSAGISWFAEPVAPQLRFVTHSSKPNITSIDIAIPSATQAGDFLVLIVAQTSNAATLFNNITGWTKQGEQRAGGAAHTIAVFTRYHNGADTFVTSSSVNSENYVGQLRIYSGVDQTTALDTSVVFSQVDPAATSAATPAATVVTPYSTIISAYSVPTSVGVNYAPGDWTDPPGLGHEFQTCSANGSTNNAALATYDSCAYAAGSQGAYTATITESRRWALATIVLRHA